MRDADKGSVYPPIMDFRNGSDYQIPGDHAGGATPVPIPNTEVKPSRADDTAAARLWESRALPGSSEAHGCANPWAFLLALSTTVLHRGQAAHRPDEKEWPSKSRLATLGEIFIDRPAHVST